MTTTGRVPFIVIGENVHATRSLSRQGRHIVRIGDVERIAFRDAFGEERAAPLAGPVAASAEFAKGKVKHIRNALFLGLGGDAAVPVELTGTVDAEAATTGRDYLVAAARRQQAAGAHYIDVNVDEISPDEAIRVTAMEWLVRLLEPRLSVPISLDSSSMAVLEGGFRASVRPSGPLLLNSASAERPEAIDLAVTQGASVVLSAAGKGSLPSTVEGRVENARVILGQALARGLAPADLYVDLLVLPAAVDGDAASNFLEAVRQFRAEHGPEVRITGGLSNVSFGLPNRKLINDAFLALAMDASVDSGIMDPIAMDVERIRGIDRSARPFRLAADVLSGEDMFAVEYLTAFRAGELAEA